jgi:hypothetical protein
MAAPTQQEFAKHLGTKFQVQVASEQTIDVELVEVSELKQSPRQEQFGILFRGPNEFFLGQGTRRLHHQEVGSTELFLVPIRQDATGFYYEAIFNHVREQT